jgi:DNA-binding response OmpR family regulator
MTGSSMRILVLEDDTRLREAYAAGLRSDGYLVEEVSTLAEARASLGSSSFDCLVLDRRVPDGDSVDLVAEVDSWRTKTRMLLLSALGDGDDRVQGLAAGADDYMVKPVHLEELALRVRNLLVRMPSRPSTLELGRVMLHRDHRQVTFDGSIVHLTPTQYAVLELLARNVDSLVTKESLLDHGWDKNRTLGGNPLHSHITRLRRIFEGALVFESTWGVGYTLRVGDPGTVST